MTTLDQLVADVRQQFQNYLEDEPEFATLAGNISDSDTTILVDSATHIDRGVIEIDDELILVSSVDKSLNALTVRLRGHLATTAAAHTQGALVTVLPLVPNSQIKRAINDTIVATYPTLFQVKTAPLINFDVDQNEYELPADVGDILSVKFSTPVTKPWWQPAKVWELDEHADVTDFPNGKALWFGDSRCVPGQNIQVVYIAQPDSLSAGSDTLEGDAGLPASTRDLIGFGAMARLLPAVEAGRLTHTSIEQSVRDQVIRPQDAANTARYYLQMYQVRLAEEGERLNDLHRAQVRVTF